ncbi:MAG: carbon monoxide dehydrogenase subunit G [Chloroflexota bacterium]|nr:MAG: carbon monoxide dehydrogenase subunit G [Chloroflexota bacterium]
MDVAGEYTFDAPQELVWQALQDPQVLASVMPGGEEFKEVGENEYSGFLNIRVGPVQGRFAGKIKLTDIVEPTSYKMSVDGKGAPGFVRASGRLELNGQGDATDMVYEGTAQIGGRIASVGQRLLDASAKSIIRQSLDGLNEYLKAQAALAAADSAETQEEAEQPTAPAPALDYKPPSQTSVAMNVAKDVAGDLIKPEYRPVIFGVVAILVVVILILIFT